MGGGSTPWSTSPTPRLSSARWTSAPRWQSSMPRSSQNSLERLTIRKRRKKRDQSRNLRNSQRKRRKRKRKRRKRRRHPQPQLRKPDPFEKMPKGTFDLEE